MRRGARGLLALSAVTGLLVAGCSSSGSSGTSASSAASSGSSESEAVSSGSSESSASSSSASITSSAGTSSAGGGTADFAGPVDIGGGREIYLECRGSGSPTVVLISGYHDNAVLWSTAEPNPPAVGPSVLDGVAQTHRVCAFDRPGTLDYTDSPPAITTRSTPVTMPRTAGDVVGDLHALLEAAEVPPPYILVPHSLGGLFARLYTQTYPDEVAGLVLVDTFPSQMPELMADLWPAYNQLLDQPGTPEDTKPGFEVIDIDASLAQLAAAPPIKDTLPIVVLSKTLPFPLPEGDIGFTTDQLEQAWVAGQDALTALATNTPHTWATGSDHYVQVRDPDIVIGAVRLIAARAADG